MSRSIDDIMNRDSRGRWLPGYCPNLNGRPARALELGALAKPHSEAALLKLVELARDPAQPENVQAFANAVLLNMSYRQDFGRYGLSKFAGQRFYQCLMEPPKVTIKELLQASPLKDPKQASPSPISQTVLKIILLREASCYNQQLLEAKKRRRYAKRMKGASSLA